MTILLLASMQLADAAKPKALGSLAISPIASGGLCPGEAHTLEITATEGSGKARKVKPERDGVNLTWELGPVGKDGTLEMTLDPRAAWGKEGIVTVTSVASPANQATLAVPLRFDCTVTVDFSGREGEAGAAGDDGSSTRSSGLSGTLGQPGDKGQDAPEVHVRVTRVVEPRTQTPVLQAEIQRLGDDEVRYVALATTGAELVVMANGGQGGMGGRGGDGGDGDPGGPGGVGGGNGGHGGDGGTGGHGGEGGAVVVFVDTSAREAVKLVVENAGGPGGMGGGGGPPGSGGGTNTARAGKQGPEGGSGNAGPSPEIREAVVAPLW